MAVADKPALPESFAVPGRGMQPAGRAVITRTSYSDDGDGEGQEKDPKKPDSHNGAKETMGSTPPW